MLVQFKRSASSIINAALQEYLLNNLRKTSKRNRLKSCRSFQVNKSNNYEKSSILKIFKIRTFNCKTQNQNGNKF